MSEEEIVENFSQEIVNNNEISIEILPIFEKNIDNNEDDIVEPDECKICNLEKEIIEESEKFKNKIELLERNIEILNNTLSDKLSYIVILQEDLKNKDILLNNKTDKNNELLLELQEIKHKNKQQNMVSLLTKLKTNEIKVPIIVQTEINNDDDIEYINKNNNLKSKLIKNRRKIC
jgi:hypothetical protein